MDLHKRTLLTLASISLFVAPACSGVMDDHAVDDETGASQSALARRPKDPGDDPDPGPRNPPPRDPLPPKQTIPRIPGGPTSPTTLIAQGSGWTHYRINGTFRDADANVDNAVADKDIIVARGPLGVANAPISAKAKTALAAGDGTLSFKRGGDEAADADMVYIIDRASAEGLDQPNTSGVIAKSSGCDNYYKDYSMDKGYSKSGSLDKKWTSGDFVGEFKVDAQSSGDASATVRLKVKRGSVFGFCIPYAVGFVNVRLKGGANALADIETTGNFRKKWDYKTTIAKPDIASFPFMVGPVPVLIGFNLPIEAGVSANAFTAASIKGQAHAEGNFDYTCTTSSCSGDKSFTAGFTPNGDPQAFVSERVQVDPWVQAALRAYLYSDSIVYGQVGVRAGVDLDLFGYAGNACGDADGDGTNEYVAGTSLDTWLRVDLTARAYALGSDWNDAWNLVHYHLGFIKWGSANAPWTPMLRTTGVDMLTASIVAGTRPCWPYTDAVATQVTWGDGATSPSTSAVGVHPFEHAYAARGTYPVAVTLGTDAAGRDLGSSATKNVRVTGLPGRLVLGVGRSELLAVEP